MKQKIVKKKVSEYQQKAIYNDKISEQLSKKENTLQDLRSLEPMNMKL